MQRGLIAGELAFVFCNREPGESRESDRIFELARSWRVPALWVSSRRFAPTLWRTDRPAWRRRFDRVVRGVIDPFGAEVLVMAGYMLIVSEVLYEAYPVLNLHPALPGGPTGSWQEVIREVIRRGEPRAGAMVHLATGELDRGPVVSWCSFSLEGLEGLGEQERFRAIRAEEFRREVPLLVLTLSALSRGRVRLRGGRVWVDEREAPQGLCLDPEVERELGGRRP